MPTVTSPCCQQGPRGLDLVEVYTGGPGAPYAYRTAEEGPPVEPAEPVERFVACLSAYLERCRHRFSAAEANQLPEMIAAGIYMEMQAAMVDTGVRLRVRDGFGYLVAFGRLLGHREAVCRAAAG